MKRNLLIAAAVTALSIGAISPVIASADSNGGSTIADKIATKFNLSKDEVQKVIQEEKQNRQKEREQKFNDRLAEAVKKGKLTQEQADKIKQKKAELKSEREKNRVKFKSMTHEERHEAMEKKRTELQQWAKDNGIDEQYIMPDFGGHKQGGLGHMGRGER